MELRTQVSVIHGDYEYLSIIAQHTEIYLIRNILYFGNNSCNWKVNELFYDVNVFFERKTVVFVCPHSFTTLSVFGNTALNDR